MRRFYFFSNKLFISLEQNYRSRGRSLLTFSLRAGMWPSQLCVPPGLVQQEGSYLCPRECQSRGALSHLNISGHE